MTWYANVKQVYANAYGGILPFRLHHFNKGELISRVDVLKKLKEINPKMKLYVFGLIMRCPSYSSNDEEPDYYEDFGAEIHLYGKYTHLEKLGKLTDKDREDFKRIKSFIGKDALKDYITRREINLSVLMYKEGLLLNIHAYADRNTSSNTIGATLCQAILYTMGKNKEGNREFLLHRYYEDIGYMAYTRQYVTENYLPDMGLDFRHADSKNGEVARLVKKAVCKYMSTNYPELAKLVKDVNIKMPWIRMFETDVKLKLK